MILKSFIIIFTLPFREVKLQEKRNRIRVLSVATSTLYSLRSGFHPWQRGVGKTASTVDPISKPLWHRTSQEVKRNCTPLKHRLLLQVPFPSCLLINFKSVLLLYEHKKYSSDNGMKHRSGSIKVSGLLSTTNAISNTWSGNEVEPNYLLKCEWESRRRPVRELKKQIWKKNTVYWGET